MPPTTERLAPVLIQSGADPGLGRRYSGAQKGPALPNFFNDKSISDAYSFTRER